MIHKFINSLACWENLRQHYNRFFQISLCIFKIWLYFCVKDLFLPTDQISNLQLMHSDKDQGKTSWFTIRGHSFVITVNNGQGCR